MTDKKIAARLLQKDILDCALYIALAVTTTVVMNTVKVLFSKNLKSLSSGEEEAYISMYPILVTSSIHTETFITVFT